MKTTILGLIGVLAVVGGIYWLSGSSTTTRTPITDTVMEKVDDAMEIADHNEDAMMADDEAMMKKEDGAVEEGEAMIKKEDGDSMEKVIDEEMEKAEEATMKKMGSFVELKDTDISTLSGKIVLDFSATWCPSCQAFKKDVEASLGDIPADTTIVLVDYDNSTDMKVKYGVTTQHTFVQVTSAGEKIKSWRGGNTLEEVLENIQ